MNSRRPIQNRRQEPRQYCFGEKLSWREEGTGYKRRKGWLNDVSTSGLSFLVEARRRPCVGSELELLREPGEDATVCKVVRMEPLDGNLTLIACRRDPAVRVPRPVQPSGQPAPVLRRKLVPQSLQLDEEAFSRAG